jgi:hypothetical protein
VEGYDQQLREELLSLAGADQYFRRTWAGLDGDAIRAAMAAERARAARLAEIVDERGWPGAPMVGDEGTRAAWLIVQHADHDVDFQERALELLAAAVERGEAPRSVAALLTDRVCVNRGRPQLYGTQFFGHGASFGPRPIRDPETLDARRSAAGLEPFEAYEQRMRELDDEHGGTRTHVR